MLSCSGEDRDSNFVPPERGLTSDRSKITRTLVRDDNKGSLKCQMQKCIVHGTFNLKRCVNSR
jgi:hypothetical protein